MSVTVGLAERSIGSHPSSRFDPSRDFWYAGVISLFMPQTADSLVNICGSLESSPPDYYTKFGQIWLGTTFANSWYNHCSTPNSKIADCTVEPITHAPATDPINFVAVSARGNHKSGAHTLAMDGSVHFVKDGINLEVWRSLGTRASGETVASDY
jgi:hypothetical protein